MEIVVLKIEDMNSIKYAYMVDIFTEREPTLVLHIIANVINLLKSRGVDIVLTYRQEVFFLTSSGKWALIGVALHCPSCSRGLFRRGQSISFSKATSRMFVM